MKLETAIALVDWGDDEDAENYEEIGESTQVEKLRWVARHSQIYKHKTEGTFWDVRFYTGLSEVQECNDKAVTVWQCWPTEKTVIVYTKTNPAEVPQ